MKGAATSTLLRCGWWPIASSSAAPGGSKTSTCEGATFARAHYPRVADLIVDDLTRADEAFAGNRLLSTFSPEARALIEPFGTLVELAPGDVVLRRGDEVEASVFPVGPTMVSMAVELSGGRTIEVASVGREGAVGGIVS